MVLFCSMMKIYRKFTCTPYLQEYYDRSPSSDYFVCVLHYRLILVLQAVGYVIVLFNDENIS
jgi:hypothetical protein